MLAVVTDSQGNVASQVVDVVVRGGLRALAEQVGLEIGAAVGVGYLRNDTTYRETLAREFTTVTPENAMKFAWVHPSEGVYDFGGADEIVDFAEANDMAVRGHTLVWHSAVPEWVTAVSRTKPELEALLHDHISTVVDHYRGRLHAWDVVNEPLESNGPNLRSSIWHDTIGTEYIDLAFRWAHEADPEALLFLNDVCIMRESTGKMDAVYNLVAGMLDRGVPIHGIGMEMHLRFGSNWYIPSAAELRSSMDRFAELGLIVHVTEMDVQLEDPPTQADLLAQADIFKTVFQVCVEAPNCHAFVTWGVSDGNSWIPEYYPGWGSALLFDEDYLPKLAYSALLQGEHNMLSRAAAYWAVRDYSGSGDLLDGSGDSHDAVPNGPLFLDYDGTQYLYTTGVVGNVISAPHIAAYNVNGDLEIEVLYDLLTDTPSVSCEMLGHGGYSQENYIFFKGGPGGTAGKLWFRWIDSGDAGHDIFSNPIANADGYKVTLDVDNGSTEHVVTFYKTDDQGETWDLAQAPIVLGGTTDIRDYDAPMYVGSKISGQDQALGKYRRAIVRDGIGGTVVFDANLTDAAALTEPFASFTEGSANAATVTITRSATGVKYAVVDRKMFLLGTDDRFEVADHADLDFGASDDLTVILVGRTYDTTPGSDQVLLAKKTDLTTAAGYALYNDTGGAVNVLIADGTADDEDATGALTNGQLFTVALRRDTGADEIEAFLDGSYSGSATSDSTTDPLTNASDLYIGSESDGASYFDGEFFGAAVFAEALSVADTVSAGNELLAARGLQMLMANEGLRVGVR